MPSDSGSTFDPFPLIAALRGYDVEFVVIGAVAAIAQGYPLTTRDLDVTPLREHENTERLATALRELDAKLRTPSEPIELVPYGCARLRITEVPTTQPVH